MTSIVKISTEIVDECIDNALQNVTNKSKSIRSNNKKIVMKESKKRSCVKAITWRILATLTTMSISYFYLNDMSVAAKIGLIDSGIKFAIHYTHERAYSRLKWGYVEKEIDC